MAAAFSNAKLVCSDPGVAIVKVSLVLSGSYSTGGDTLPDFATLPFLGILRPGQIVAVDFYGINGYFYQWNGSATATNAQKVKIATASNTELAAGAYPAGITGDTIFVVVTISTLPR